MEKHSYLAEEKIGRLMRKYAVPCIISLLVGALYNIVDQIFIANADYLGSYGNAANTFIFLQAMGKAVESTMLSMVREILLDRQNIQTTKQTSLLIISLFRGKIGVYNRKPYMEFIDSNAE